MKRLLLSIHDVTPAHGGHIARLEAEIAAITGGSATYAMLVVPDFHGRAPIVGNATFRAWLRARSAAGVEMLLHGWSHRDDAPTGFRARHMTAAEGEFANLPHAEATRRLTAGRALLQDILGAPVTGFVAPAWLYSAAAKAAVADLGFRVAEDHMRVWSPVDGRVLARGPVVSYASRSPARMWSSLAWSRVATTLLGGLGAARVALHPGDVGEPRLVAELRRAIGALLERRQLGRYDALAAT